MPFTEPEKKALDTLIMRWIREQPGRPWLFADQVASGVRSSARKAGIIESAFGLDATAVGYRLRTLRKRGELVNRPTDNPYMAGNYEWRLAR